MAVVGVARVVVAAADVQLLQLEGLLVQLSLRGGHRPESQVEVRRVVGEVVGVTVGEAVAVAVAVVAVVIVAIAAVVVEAAVAVGVAVTIVVIADGQQAATAAWTLVLLRLTTPLLLLLLLEGRWRLQLQLLLQVVERSHSVLTNAVEVNVIGTGVGVLVIHGGVLASTRTQAVSSSASQAL